MEYMSQEQYVDMIDFFKVCQWNCRVQDFQENCLGGVASNVGWILHAIIFIGSFQTDYWVLGYIYTFKSQYKTEILDIRDIQWFYTSFQFSYTGSNLYGEDSLNIYFQHCETNIPDFNLI